MTLSGPVGRVRRPTPVLASTAGRTARIGALAAVLMLTGCSNDVRRLSSDPTPSPLPGAEAEWDANCAEEQMSGRMIAVAGPDPLNAQLWSVQLCPVSIGRLTPYDRFDSVAHGNRTTVVSTARNKTSALERLDVNELVPIPGLGQGRAFSPAVSAKGIIAYIDPEQPDTPEGSRLRTWDPKAQADAVVLTSTQLLSTPAYGPDDALAVAEPTATGDSPVDIVLTGPDGAQRRLPTPLTSVGGMAWSSQGRIAVSAESEDTSPTRVLNASDGQVVAEFDAEWKVRDWSPDGSLLLLRRGDEMGVWRDGRPEPVVLGTLAVGPVYDAAWLPESG